MKNELTITTLNPNQLSAVNILEGPLLILAGAGTGKTFTIINRIVNLIISNVTGAHNILAVTFTNKAAREMRERIDKMVVENNINMSGMWIGTFHGLSAKILRMHAQAINLSPNFVILDENDKKRIIKQVIEECNIDDKRFSVNFISFLLSTLKESCVKEHDEAKISTFKYKDLNVSEIYQKYQSKLRALNAVDFDDLLLECVELFKKNPQILSDLQDRFQHIFVDEYQDTNKIQHLWLKLLASKYYNICCVGDEDQSIYGWRGADIKHIMNFSDDFVGAKIIRLEENYRSTPEILKVANSVIENNKQRYGKNLISILPNYKKPKVTILEDDRKEAIQIAKKIQDLNTQYDYKNMAILVRAGYQTRIIEEALIGNAVPYKVLDSLKFYDRKEIKDLIYYLRFTYTLSDTLALERIINVPRRGIGEKTFSEILHYSSINNCSDIVEAIQEIIQNEAFSAKILEQLHLLVEKFINWNELISLTTNTSGKLRGELPLHLAEVGNHRLRGDGKAKSLTEIAEKIYHESGYAKMLEEAVKDNSDEEKRIENVREFLSSLKQFDNIEQFLEHIALLSSTDENIADQNAVNIMTMHGSKGLEFDVTLLPGWDEDIFPSKKSIDESGDKGLEEERRLAYVAITRAKKEFYIYTCKQRMIFGRINSCIPSRFIGEMKDCVELIDNTDNKLSDNNMQKNYNGNNFYNYKNNKLNYNNKNNDVNNNYDKKIIKTEKSLVKAVNELEKGEKVTHAKFGEGTIKGVIGQFYEIHFNDGITRVIKKDFI